MKRIVFYSWQSDLPNPTNRGFIQAALEKAAANISSDDTVAVEPVVDRDTQGVPGSPDIAATIFAKIIASDVFVADVSIVSEPGAKRPTPNPNVLIELGYALKALGHEKVVLVFNKSFGRIEDLPFDLRVRRVLQYEMEADNKDRASARDLMSKHLEEAIRVALHHAADPADAPISVIEALENDQRNKVLMLRRTLADLLQDLKRLEPRKHSEGGTADDLISAISSTQETVATFSKIVETIAVLNDADAALEVYRWFGKIMEAYDLPADFSGRSSKADFDYYKFLGHELLTTVVAFLIREERWELLERILSEPIPVGYIRSENGPGSLLWHSASEHLPLLLDESRARKRMSLHADILHERHANGGLSSIVPADMFMEADFFLFLYGEITTESPGRWIRWRPWSALYMKRAPVFLKKAATRRYANQLLHIFSLSALEEFRQRFWDRAPRLSRLYTNGLWDFPVDQEVIDRMGTEG